MCLCALVVVNVYAEIRLAHCLQVAERTSNVFDLPIVTNKLPWFYHTPLVCYLSIYPPSDVRTFNSTDRWSPFPTLVLIKYLR